MLEGTTQAILSGGGWFPERRVNISRWVEILDAEEIEVHATAREFLQEFGGITIEQKGPGITRAREPFAIDPTLCIGEGDRFIAWSLELDRQIVPVGELAHGRFFLGLDENSELYAIESWVSSFGRMPEAMNNLVLGVMPTPIQNGSGPSQD